MVAESAVLALARELIRRPSVTPEDGGCQALIAQRLVAAGFVAKEMPYGAVSNLWAVHGDEGPIFCLAGHTDVVSPGAQEAWTRPPFAAEIDAAGYLYGRGAADMKGSLAALVLAAEGFVAAHPRHKGRLAFLITSDEEAVAVDGTARVIEELSRRGERIHWSLIGEPSCTERLGDTLKNGRRGSLNAHLTLRGVQGHIAYHELADNPIHRALAPLSELVARRWDEGGSGFPPTSFQLSNVQAGTGADNVIPGELSLRFNFRYNPQSEADWLRAEVLAVLERHGCDYTLDWRQSGVPFFCPPGALQAAVRESVREQLGIEPEAATSGGTSDGRFFAPTGAEVVEFGPVNATIHQVDECVAVEDLEALVEIYQGTIARVLGEGASRLHSDHDQGHSGNASFLGG